MPSSSAVLRALAAGVVLAGICAVQRAEAQSPCPNPNTVTTATGLAAAVTCANAAGATYGITTGQTIDITGVPLTSTNTGVTAIFGSPITSTTASGTADLTQSGSGVTLLNGAGLTTYTGETSVSAGTLRAGEANAFSPNSAFVVSGGTIDLQGFSNTIGSLAGTGGLITDSGTLAPATLTTGGNGASTSYSGTLADESSALGFQKSGAGALALTGANTYSGGTTISGGALQVNNSTLNGNTPISSSIGTGTLTLNGGTLQAVVAQGTSITFANAINVTAAGGTFDSNGANSLNFSGPISRASSEGGIGTVTFNDSSANSNPSLFDFVVSGTNTTNGQVIVSGSTNLQTTSTNALGTGQLTINQGGVVHLAGNTLAFQQLNGAGTINADGFQVGTNVATTFSVANGSFSGRINNGTSFDNQGANYSGTLGLIKVSDNSASGGTLTLSGSSNYSGGTQLESGEIAVGNSTALGSGTLTMSSGTTLQVITGVTLQNAAVLNGIDTFETTAVPVTGEGLIYSGVISGTGTLVKTGPGASGLRLTAANTYSGGTVLIAGHIGIDNNAAFGTGAITFAGGFLRAHADGFTLNNAAILSSAGTIDTNGFGLTYAGVISGQAQFIKAGLGMLTLSGVNTYTGGTAIDAGVVAITNGLALGTGTVTFAGGNLQAAVDGLTLGNAVMLAANGTVDTQAFGSTITSIVSGPGQLTKAGIGTLTLTGANSYSGGTLLNAGTLAIGGSNALGTGALTFNGGSLQAATDGLTLGNAVTLAANGTVDTQAFGLTATGIISGPGQLTKAGTGTLTLTGANTYSGGTALNAGTLAIGGNNALGTGAVTFNGGMLQAAVDGLTLGNAVTLAVNGTVDTQAFGLTATGILSGPGQLTKAGTGTLTLTGANSYSGGTLLNAGTLAIGGNNAIGTGTVTFNGGTLQAATDGMTFGNAVALATNGTVDTQAFGLTSAGIISGPGQLTKAGIGTLTLTGANTYSGGTALKAGTLAIGNSGALGTGAVTFNGGSLQAAADGLTLGNAANLATNGTINTQAFGLTATGVISGAGQLAKAGTGTLTLTGANTYSGGTALNAGTIALGNGTALGTGTVTFAGGTLQAAADGLTIGNAASLSGTGAIDTQAFTLAYGGAITGPGALAKLGAGTLLLTGANSYAGGTSIDGGTIEISNGTALGTGTVTFGGGSLQAAADITLGSTTTLAGNATLDTQGFNIIETGTLAGAGQLTKIGSGTLTLTGANSYSGGTALNAGTLAVGSSSALGIGALTFNGGTLQAAIDGLTLGNAVTLPANGTVDTQAFSMTAAGIISGPGQLTKAGTGTLTLTGANSYSGGTALNAGTLAVGSSGALGIGALTFNGGTLQAAIDGLTLGNAVTLPANGTVDTQAFSMTAAGIISGPGQLTKAGTGTLTLTGANSYSGGTALNAGTLALANGTALGTGSVTFSGGGLQAAAEGLTANNAIVLASNGMIDTQAFGLTATGVISGPGQLTKAGTGALTLTGANSYSGGTALNAGTIALGNGTALGTGSVTFGSGGLQAAAEGLTVSNAVTLAGNGTIDTQAFGLTYAGAIAGSGQLNKAGTGTLTLTGANSYSGGTALNAGTIALGNGTALGTGTVTFGGGTIQAAADGLTANNAIVLAINGTIDTQAFGLTATGAISGVGQLVKAGTGTLTMTAANTFSGGMLLNAGTIAIGGSNALGTGALTFNGGSLEAATDGLTLGNAVVLFGNGAIDTQGFGLTATGAISGAGQLTKAGTGTLTLTGANSYSGPTSVAAGALQAGSATALSPTSAFSIAGGATLDLKAFNNTVGSLAGAGTVTNSGTATATLTEGGTNASTTFAGVLADGAAPLALAKAGSGTLTLSGISTYSGGTTVLGGTLAVTSSTALGTGPLALDDLTTLQLADGVKLANAIALTGTQDPVIDTGSGSEVISGAISGPGALTKVGSGTLDLTGTDTYTGATSVAAGTLLVDGALVNSTVTVANGAELGGTGSIASLIVSGGATLAAASARPLTITGNTTFLSGSTYQVTINPDGTGSKLAVGGTASLGGATLSVLAGSGTFSAGSYQILTAAGGVSGTFGTVATANSLAFFDPKVSYGAGDVTLTLQPIDFASAAATPDQAAVASAVQGLGPTSPLYNAVAGLSRAGAQQAFTSLSGVSHASTTSTVTSNLRVATGLVIDRLWDVSGSGLSAQQVLDQFAPDRMPALVRCYGPVAEPAPAAVPPTYTAWGEGFGTFGHTDGGANAGALDRSLGGFVLGVDAPLSGIPGNAWRGGVAGGYTDTTFRSRLDGGTGSVQGVFGSLYGGARYGAVDIRIGSTIGGNFVDAQRTVAFPGVLENETSFNRGVTVQTFGEIGYRIPTATFVIEPVAGAAFLYSHQEGFSERGGAAALTVSPLSTDLGTTSLGFRGEMQPFKTLPIITHAYIAWQHVIGNVSPATTLAFEAAPSNTFSVTGAPIDRDAVAAEFAVDYRASSKLDVGISYTGLVGATSADHSIKGRAEYRF